jgi:phosphocarrier protein HPr
VLTKELTIKNKSGLHARPATKFVKFAAGFKSQITIKYKDKLIDAKSIVALLTGGISSGSNIVLNVKGEDEETALQQIAAFIENLED